MTVADLDGETAAHVAAEIKELGGESLALTVDVTSQKETQRMVRQATDQLGNLRILVNNAGIGAVAPLLETNVQMWGRHDERKCQGRVPLLTGGRAPHDRAGRRRAYHQ